jgi:hypothetical protein
MEMEIGWSSNFRYEYPHSFDHKVLSLDKIVFDMLFFYK